MRGPDLVGLGAQKAATSWLYACLEEHPSTCMPVKELHFFSRDRNWRRGFGWYESRFDSCPPDAVTGEISTSYLSDPRVPGRISERYPQARLLVCLRNPIDRAVSNFRNDVMAGDVPAAASFDQALADHPEYVEHGRYARHLTRVLEFFPRSQLHIVLYDDVEIDPAGVVAGVYRFLGLDDRFVPRALHERINPSRVPRSVAVERGLGVVGRGLRAVGLGSLVAAARRAGLTRRLRDVNASADAAPSGPDERQRARLAVLFEADVTAVEELTGRSLEGWRR